MIWKVKKNIVGVKKKNYICKKINVMNQLNPYKISWLIIEPEKGVVTKHDRKMFGMLNSTDIRNKKAFIHFSDRGKAVNFAKSFDKKLDKKYQCRIITDA